MVAVRTGVDEVVYQLDNMLMPGVSCIALVDNPKHIRFIRLQRTLNPNEELSKQHTVEHWKFSYVFIALITGGLYRAKQ
jgi:hypothetical protein